MRKAMAEGKQVVAAFVYLEKAYDQTWRYGMRRGMYLCYSGAFHYFSRETG